MPDLQDKRARECPRVYAVTASDWRRIRSRELVIRTFGVASLGFLRVGRVRACPRVLWLVYPPRTRVVLSVLKTEDGFADYFGEIRDFAGRISQRVPLWLG